MVSKTPAGEIRRLLDEQYGLKMGKILRSHQGLSNYNIIVNTLDGQLFIRIHKNADLTSEKLSLEARVADFLTKNGFLVRTIVKTYDGRNFARTSFNEPLSVFRFLAGRYLTKVEPHHLVEVGSFLKKLHNTLSNFENQGQLIHGDFNPGNFVFTNDRISGIFDFEHVHYGAVAEDLATLLAHYVFLLPDWPPRDIVTAVLAGYTGQMTNILSTEIVKKAEWLASWQSGLPEFYNKRLTELRNSVNL